MTLLHEPLVLQTDPAPLVAMLTEPTAPAVGLGVVLFSPGGYTISAQRNRWGAKLSDRLAAAGIHTIRFDYHGIGDSAGDIQLFAHDVPFVADGRAVVEALAERGVTDLVLIGQCFGARTALALVEELDGVRGLFAISPSVRDTGRGEGNAAKMAHDAPITDYVKHAFKVFDPALLRDPGARRRYLRMAKTFVSVRFAKLKRALIMEPPDPTPWVSRGFLRQVTHLVDRDIPLAFVYGAAEEDSTDFAAAKEGRLGDVIARGGRVEEYVLEGRVHNLGRVDVQDQLVEMMVGFAGARAEEMKEQEAST